MVLFINTDEVLNRHHTLDSEIMSFRAVFPLENTTIEPSIAPSSIEAQESGRSLSSGTIAGISIACVIILLLLVGCVLFIKKAIKEKGHFYSNISFLRFDESCNINPIHDNSGSDTGISMVWNALDSADFSSGTVEIDDISHSHSVMVTFSPKLVH